MSFPHGWFCYIEDNLVARYYKLTKDGRLDRTTEPVSKGKRLRKDFNLLTREEVREYVKKGPIHTVKMIKYGRNIPLAEAYRLMKTAQGKQKHYHHK